MTICAEWCDRGVSLWAWQAHRGRVHYKGRISNVGPLRVGLLRTGTNPFWRVGWAANGGFYVAFGVGVFLVQHRRGAPY